MKRFVLMLGVIFFCMNAIAQTISIDWKIGNNIYSQSTCEYGGDLNVPTAPTKYGYTFQGWISFAPIEYIESTGTQYIDTGYRFNDNIKVVFKANWPVLSNYLFGANSNSGENFFVANGGYLMGVPFSFSPAIQSNTDTIIEMQMYKGDAYLKINDVTVAQNTSTSANNKPIYLFATIENSSSGISPVSKRVRIYYFKMYQNDILVRDFIPVLDKDGIPCMYDKVEDKFYYNKGDSDFIAGPVI